MRSLVLVPVLLLALASAVSAAEICGNPCEDGYVWTDRDMGKCVPAPVQPVEKPTS